MAAADDEYKRYLFGRMIQVGLPEVDKLIESNIESRPYLVAYRKTRKFAPLPKDKNDMVEDRISELPDDILYLIISFLSMREGAATCLLSRRWRSLWTDSVSRLDFTDSNVFGCNFPADILQGKQRDFLNMVFHRIPIDQNLRPRHNKRKGFMATQRTVFRRRVNQILQLCRASTINKFLVSFPLGKESASHVDVWMKLAAAQGVATLELNFNWTDFRGLRYDREMYYKFPVQEFGSSLKYLRLTFCTIKFPRKFQGLNSLVSLSLSQSRLTKDTVQTILSNCPRLEFLSLRNCNAVYHPTTLTFVGPSISLKHLDIAGCIGIEEIELQDVNLLSFELDQRYMVSFDLLRKPEMKLSIKNAPLLARLVLKMNLYGSVETLSNVPRLETLFLNHRETKLPKLSAFGNLKRLVFSANYNRSNLFEMVCFLDACPLLQQLHVDMGDSSEWDSDDNKLTEQSRKFTMRDGCPHNNLKEVEIYEFDNHPIQIELAKYLLKNAMVLESMKICTTCKSYCVHGLWNLSQRSVRPVVQMSLNEVRELLLKEKRASTKLLVGSK